MGNLFGTDSSKKALKTMIRIAVALLAVALICFAGSRVCQQSIDSEYKKTRTRIETENQDNQLSFDTQMNTLRAQAAAANNVPVVQEAPEVLESWTADLGGSTWRVDDMGSSGIENADTITMSRKELMNGGLLLINAWHALPSDFDDTELVSVGKATKLQVNDNNVKLFQPAIDALEAALNAAKEEKGLEHYIVREGYRSVSEQETLFNARVEKLAAKNTYSGDRLIEEAKKDVNYPGTSDYHSGLSFRMDLYDKNDPDLKTKKFQADSEQGAWLTENCWRFGIIFRFPGDGFPNDDWTDKSYKTGVSAQINLYRYVGKAHATVMRAMDLCLEEYIEFLIAHPHLCIYENDTLKYEIVRLNASGNDTEYRLPLPLPAQEYTGSLDNMDGIVMAYSY